MTMQTTRNDRRGNNTHTKHANAAGDGRRIRVEERKAPGVRTPEEQTAREGRENAAAESEHRTRGGPIHECRNTEIRVGTKRRDRETTTRRIITDSMERKRTHRKQHVKRDHTAATKRPEQERRREQNRGAEQSIHADDR